MGANMRSNSNILGKKGGWFPFFAAKHTAAKRVVRLGADS